MPSDGRLLKKYRRLKSVASCAFSVLCIGSAVAWTVWILSGPYRFCGYLYETLYIERGYRNEYYDDVNEKVKSLMPILDDIPLDIQGEIDDTTTWIPWCVGEDMTFIDKIRSTGGIPKYKLTSFNPVETVGKYDDYSLPWSKPKYIVLIRPEFSHKQRYNIVSSRITTFNPVGRTRTKTVTYKTGTDKDKEPPWRWVDFYRFSVWLYNTNTDQIVARRDFVSDSIESLSVSNSEWLDMGCSEIYKWVSGMAYSASEVKARRVDQELAEKNERKDERKVKKNTALAQLLFLLFFLAMLFCGLIGFVLIHQIIQDRSLKTLYTFWDRLGED